MNVTVSIDDEVAERARDLAERRGMSLDELIRMSVEELVRELTPQDIVAKLNELWAAGGGDFRGSTWTREELHERTGVR